MATADRVYISIPAPLEETVNAEDAYNVEVSNLIVYQLQDAVHASDTYNMVKVDMVKRRLVEEVHTHEVGLQSTPWSEDPSILRYFYIIWEKILPVDEALWYYIENGVKIGGYVDSNGVNYSYRGRPIEYSVKPEDAVSIIQYTEYVSAKKYDGHVKAETIYNYVSTKYDGYIKAETIYNYVNTKYDGYVKSSISLS